MCRECCEENGRLRAENARLRIAIEAAVARLNAGGEWLQWTDLDVIRELLASAAFGGAIPVTIPEGDADELS